MNNRSKISGVHRSHFSRISPEDAGKPGSATWTSSLISLVTETTPMSSGSGEVLVAGKLKEVVDDIERIREDARQGKGWIMDNTLEEATIV